jgi:RHS repeat-associated protein
LAIYDAFGALTSSSETLANGWSNPYRYDGAELVRYDPETNLYWMRVRAYDPTLGRFISHDPLGRLAAQGLDMQPYVYAGNNPVNQTDPSGLLPCGAMVDGYCRSYWDSLQTKSAQENAPDIDGCTGTNNCGWISSSGSHSEPASGQIAKARGIAQQAANDFGKLANLFRKLAIGFTAAASALLLAVAAQLLIPFLGEGLAAWTAWLASGAAAIAAALLFLTVEMADISQAFQTQASGKDWSIASINDTLNQIQQIETRYEGIEFAGGLLGAVFSASNGFIEGFGVSVGLLGAALTSHFWLDSKVNKYIGEEKIALMDD